MDIAAPKSQADPSATSQDSALLLASFGALAYAASMLTHEALGHGGFCLVAGGHNTAITLWWEYCRFPGPPRLGIKAAGPAVQFGAGLLASRVLRSVPSHLLELRCLLWLYMTFSLLIASGYVAFSGIVDAGDAAELVAPLASPIAWRIGIVLLGSAAYFFSMRLSAYDLQQLAFPNNQRPRLVRLVAIPYASAGTFACGVAVLSQFLAAGTSGGLALASPGLNRLLGPIGMAAMSSFAAASGMFGLPALERGASTHARSTTAGYLCWSATWGTAMVALLLLFLLSLGHRHP